MKKVFVIFFATLLFSCHEKVVYVTKPTLTDSTVLKAEFKVSEWATVLNTIGIQATKLNVLKDSVQKKKALDTVGMAINTIVKNLNDSTHNPIFKKS